MHDYSLDKHPKEKIYFALAFLAILIAPQASLYLSSLGIPLGIIKAIPVFLLFSLLLLLFDRVLWKIGLLRKIFLIPDLNGEWACSGETILHHGAECSYAWTGSVNIRQSWSKILIELKTPRSSSVSVSASIYSDKNTGFKLFYQYKNDPKARSADYDLNNHSGCVELLFSEDCSHAEGNYYTDQHRRTVGRMTLVRRKK